MSLYSAAKNYKGQSGFSGAPSQWCAWFASKIIREEGFGDINYWGTGSVPDKSGLIYWCSTHGTSCSSSTGGGNVVIFFGNSRTKDPNDSAYNVPAHVGFTDGNGYQISGNYGGQVGESTINSALSVNGWYIQACYNLGSGGGGGSGGGDDPGGGGGSEEDKHHKEWADWQYSSKPPKGSWSDGYPEKKTVYSYFDYSTNSWTNWQDNKPT